MRNVVFVCFVFLAAPAWAHTSGVIEQTCPLDGKTFKAELDMSGTTFGKQLDLKPVGPTAAPWRIPVCPLDGFVIYQKEFSDEELADLRSYVATPEYKAWFKKGETSHYLLARLLEHRHAPEKAVAWAFLQATWQAQKDAARYADYASEALTRYAKLAATLSETDEQWPTAALVAGALERRLGRFDDAQKRLRALIARPAFAEGFLRELCDYELVLVGKKDTAAHQMSEVSGPPKTEPRKPAP